MQSAYLRKDLQHREWSQNIPVTHGYGDKTRPQTQSQTYIKFHNLLSRPRPFKTSSVYVQELSLSGRRCVCDLEADSVRARC